jgi:hypothetical protein
MVGCARHEPLYAVTNLPDHARNVQGRPPADGAAEHQRARVGTARYAHIPFGWQRIRGDRRFVEQVEMD